MNESTKDSGFGRALIKGTEKENVFGKVDGGAFNDDVAFVGVDR
jgi:hypothetical protein